MQSSIRSISLALIVLGVSLVNLPVQASASDFPLTIASDKTTGYIRTAFKHWIDADKNGCDTRAEVLIIEAVVKPKVGKKCKLTGGQWISFYDAKEFSNPSNLDVDHLVPLSEAWKSGAWKWSAAQRESFANDLDLRTNVLVAVSASSNRSKGDKDPAKWLPKVGKDDLCQYIKDWVDVKWKYSLSVDESEATILRAEMTKCFGDYSASWINTIPKVVPVSGLSNLPKLPVPSSPLISYNEIGSPTSRLVGIQVSVENFSGFDSSTMELSFSDYKWASNSTDEGLSCTYNYSQGSISQVQRNIPVLPISFGCSVLRDRTYELGLTVRLKVQNFGMYSNFSTTGPAAIFAVPKVEASSSPTPSTTPSSIPAKPATITPGAFCTPAGASGISSSGVSYTCKTSITDTRNRWRQ